MRGKVDGGEVELTAGSIWELGEWWRRIGFGSLKNKNSGGANSSKLAGSGEEEAEGKWRGWG